MIPSPQEEIERKLAGAIKQSEANIMENLRLANSAGWFKAQEKERNGWRVGTHKEPSKRELENGE